MKPNIILVLLDGCRWDRIHVSPEFSELQKQGILFNNVTTVFPYTLGSINVIFSGLYGKENGVDGYYKVFGLRDSVKTLSEILKENGYFVSRDLLHDKLLSSRGFDIHQVHNEHEDDLTKRHPELIKTSFEKSAGRPVFTFLQFTGTHKEYTLKVLKKHEWDDHEYYSKKDQNLVKYDECFREYGGPYAKKIRETIENLGKSNETIIVFFSDHGTGVGERYGERNYGSFTYEETIRTFYLFIGPEIIKNRINDKLFSTIDIFPTILDLCGIKAMLDIPGHSFSHQLFGNSDKYRESMHVFSETGALHGPCPSPERSNVFCIKTHRHKLIFFRDLNKWEFFDLVNDPLEQHNIINKDHHIENDLKTKLLEWINR